LSADLIIQSLEELVSIHENLLTISEEKTKVIKEGSIDKLQNLLVKERKQIRLSEQAEVNRQTVVEQWCMNNGTTVDSATITNILQMLTDEVERQKLEHTATKLTETITRLKQQEQLNHVLISQSMQFVQLSLDLMSPTLKNMNYGVNKESDITTRSVFDSKA